METASASELPDNDLIRLTLPASTPYARIARVGAATLAFRWGFSQRQIQDLRLAVDEAVILLMGHQHRKGTISLEYRIVGDQMRVTGTVALADPTPSGHFFDDEAVQRFRDLAGDLLTEYELDATDHRVQMVINRA